MPDRTLRLLAALALLLIAPAAAAQPTDSAERIARTHLADGAKTYGVEAAEFGTAEVTDAYVTQITGVTHVYFRQQIGGLPVFNGVAAAHVLPSGEVLTANASFGRVGDVPPSPPALAARTALEALARDRGAALPTGLLTEDNPQGRGVVFAQPGASLAPAQGDVPTQAERGYFILRDGSIRPAWQVTLPDDGSVALEDDHLWLGFVDGLTGEVLAAHDLVIHETDAHAIPRTAATRRTLAPVDLRASSAATAPFAVPTYRVFALPMESPYEGDRELVSDPSFPAASPEGWHGDGVNSYTTTRGNNVFAFLDADITGAQEDEPDDDPAAIPDGGNSLTFDFPLDLTQSPDTYRRASITNLFYWNNIVHDITYLYGFTEAAGNFQTVNFTGNGQGSDAVRAQGQSGAGTNNANFRTPPDGTAPRMRMYIGTDPEPDVDGDFDNQVVVHEYGHGVSIRLTGGPSQVFCLTNEEQAGEGWSDWLGSILTIEPGDTGTTRRPVGTYLFGRDPVTSNGIRPRPYTTDFSVNGFTYEDISGVSLPHGVGFVFASALWDLTWNLIDEYGYNPDLYETNPANWGGNNIAFQLIMDGMKLQPCGPSQLASRDAILAADQALTGGQNQGLIWQTFARRGYGASADAGTIDRGDETEAFDVPREFQNILKVFKEASDESVASGSFITFTLDVRNDLDDPATNVTVTDDLPAGASLVPGSATGPATVSGGQITFGPLALDAGERRTLQYTVEVTAEGGSTELFATDLEESNGAFSTGILEGSFSDVWRRVEGEARSGDTAYFVEDVDSRTDQVLILEPGFDATSGTVLEFWHQFDTEESFDGGVVEFSTDGTDWEDLRPYFLENGYNGAIAPTQSNLAGRPAFTGASNGFIRSRISLGAFAGSPVQVRWRFAADTSVGGVGWYVDDIRIYDEEVLEAEACVSADGSAPFCDDAIVPIRARAAGDPSASASTNALGATVGLDDQPTATQTFTIQNTGGRELSYVFTGSGGEDLPSWLSFDARAANVDANASRQVTAQFDGTGLSAGQTYTATVLATTNDPAVPSLSFNVELIVKQSVPTEGGPVSINGTHLLGSVYPNPVRGSAQIELAVRETQAVRVEVYDVTGRRVALLHEGELASQTMYTFEFESDGLASGTYVLRASGRDFAEVRRLTVVQ